MGCCVTINLKAVTLFEMKGEKMYDHPSDEVSKALLALDSAICSWERSTGIESVLIFRERGGGSINIGTL